MEATARGAFRKRVRVVCSFSLSRDWHKNESRMTMSDSYASSNELTTVESKLKMMKERRDVLTEAKKEVDRLVAIHVEENGVDSVPMPVGCFGRLATCPRMRLFSKSGRTKLPTVEVANAAAATTVAGKAVVMSSFQQRIFGKQKGVAQQEAKIEEAMQAVAIRLESLQDRAKLQRHRAISLSQKGKREEALRELKKAKGTDKQILTVQQALDALERQSDLLSESLLQREMATALASTNQTVKAKTKGLLPASEKAIDESIELRDAAEDVAAVFEGLAPTYEHDEDELIDELDQLVGEAHTDHSEAAAPAAIPTATALLADRQAELEEVSASAFPTAPTKKPAVVAEASVGVRV